MVLSVELSAPAPSPPGLDGAGGGGGSGIGGSSGSDAGGGGAATAYACQPSLASSGRTVGPLVLGFGSPEYLEQLRCHLQIAGVEAFIQVPMQAAGEGRVNGVDALHMAGQFAYLSQNCLESCLGVCQPGLASHARGLLDQLEGRADAVELIELNLPTQVERLYRVLLTKQTSRTGQVVFVCGAVGGIGATYSAALLAWAGRELIRGGEASQPARRRDQDVCSQPQGPGFGSPAAQATVDAALVDANPYGGLDLYLGSGYCQGASWGQLPKNQSPLWPQRLVRGLGKYRGVKVLAGSGGQGGPKNWLQMSQAIYALRTSCQLTVVDLPALQLAHLPWDELGAARVLLVTDQTHRAALAARGWLQEVRPGLGALALREQGADLTSEEIARLVGAPVVCALPNRRELSQRLQLGLDPLRLKRAERKVGARLANWALNPNFWAQKGQK